VKIVQGEIEEDLQNVGVSENQHLWKANKKPTIKTYAIANFCTGIFEIAQPFSLEVVFCIAIVVLERYRRHRRMAHPRCIIGSDEAHFQRGEGIHHPVQLTTLLVHNSITPSHFHAIHPSL
jgi:hypothetical protein